MFITTIETHLSNIYNIFTQLQKKTSFGPFMLISCKSMSITTIKTYLSNIYNKFTQLQKKKTSFGSFHTNFF